MIYFVECFPIRWMIKRKCDNNNTLNYNDCNKYVTYLLLIYFILSNIFEVENKPCVIDYEWNFDCPIPVEYIMWRIVDALYSEHKELSRVIALEEFQKKLGIRLDYVQLFRRWENNFVFKYVGSNRLYHIAKDGQKIDLESIVDHRILIGAMDSLLRTIWKRK